MEYAVNFNLIEVTNLSQCYIYAYQQPEFLILKARSRIRIFQLKTGVDGKIYTEIVIHNN